ncbi:DUF6194 family protein [Actinokineospora sp. NPDC004072]
MDANEVVGFLVDELDGVLVMEDRGDSYLIYDPDGDVPYNRRFPFATVVTGDRHDTASNLDREGAFRLNLGLTKDTFRSMFDLDARVDHTAADVLMPHPVYGGQHWICVVNPTRATLEQAMPLIREAHGFAVRKHRNRLATGRR